MKLQLYYPVKPYYATQKFGETAFLQYYKDNKVDIAGHNGIDMVALHGAPIRAAHDGIAYYEVDSKQGHGVVLRSNDKFDYDGDRVYMKSIYWHMVDSAKEPKYRSPVESYADLTRMGMPVKAGDIIGYADSTGLSTGDHLHFGLKPCMLNEPEWTTYNIEQSNGYGGAIDPAPYFNGLYAEDINKPVKPLIAAFNDDMSYGSSSLEIKRLQSVLKELGYFPVEPTGYYGEVTKNSVFHFQQDHVKLTPFEYFVIAGKKVGPKTRAEINSLISQ